MLASAAQMRVSAATIRLEGQSVVLDYNDLQGDNFSIYRSTGRFTNPSPIAFFTDGKTFTDTQLDGKSPYSYYYYVYSNNELKATLSLETELFGNNVYFYSPTDDPAKVAEEFNGIGKKMFSEQFGFDRYAFSARGRHWAELSFRPV